MQHTHEFCTTDGLPVSWRSASDDSIHSITAPDSRVLVAASLGSLFQCLTTLEEAVFPNVQSEPLLVQLEAIPSSPIEEELSWDAHR